MNLAIVASSRSEDKFRKVGAVAMGKEGEIIECCYNGLPNKFKVWDGFWEDREARRKYMIHAEQNLVSRTIKGEVESAYITTMPCSSCMMLLIAHGIKNVFYKEPYPASDAEEFSRVFNINLQQIIP